MLKKITVSDFYHHLFGDFHHIHHLAGDLDVAAGRAPALHHLGPLPLLPPPPRHHHLLHHPHLHDGPGQRGKCTFLMQQQGIPWHLVFQFNLMMAGLNAKL